MGSTSTSTNVTYPYQNTLADPARLPGSVMYPEGFGSFMRKNATTNVWEYYWGSTAEVTDKEGVRGQNTMNPKSTFSTHWVAEIGGKIYDFSYGLGPYDDRKKWEDASIAGFAKVDMVAENNYRLIFRKNPEAEDIKIKQTVDQ
jgi:hypothetical protein